MKESIMIKKCNTCGNQPHAQDDFHGKGNRVHVTVKSQTSTEYRCTRCGAITKGGDTQPKK